MSKYSKTMAVIGSIRERTDTAVLYYSAGGKDSIALLDMLSPVFDRVICYYMYVVKGLSHIAPYIKWAETVYGNVEVRQIEHYQRDAIVKCGIFCDPQPEVKTRSVGEIEEAVRTETGLKYAFSGMKGVDGYMKRMRLKLYEKRDPHGFPITDKGMVYPLGDWTNGEVMAYIRKRNLITPFQYSAGTVSQGFALDLPTMLMLYTRFPSDYERVRREFPYVDKILYDYAKGKQNTTTETGNRKKK